MFATNIVTFIICCSFQFIFIFNLKEIHFQPYRMNTFRIISNNLFITWTLTFCTWFVRVFVLFVLSLSFLNYLWSKTVIVFTVIVVHCQYTIWIIVYKDNFSEWRFSSNVRLSLLTINQLFYRFSNAFRMWS